MRIVELRTISYPDGELLTVELGKITREMQDKGMCVEIQFSTAHCSTRGTTFSALIIGRTEGEKYIV